MKQNKFIPELRFPGFEGFWEEKPIEGIGNTLNGLAGKSSSDFGEGSPYVTYKQVFDKSVIDFEACEKVIINADEKQNTLQKGDILFTTSSETPYEVGFSSVLIDSPKEDTYLNSFCFAIRPFDFEIINAEFARYLFHSSNYRNAVTAIAQGSTRYNLSKSAFLRLTVSLPSFLEQQKIASCLSSLDSVIDGHVSRLDLLREHKRGLMQQLFPCEGERLPRLRFPEFKNDGEWEEGKLGEVGEFIGGGTPSTSIEEYWIGDIPWISSSDINEDDIHNISVSQYINKKSIKESATKLIPKGSILFVSRVGIGKLAVNKIELCTSQDFTSLVPRFSNNYFIAYYFLSRNKALTYISQGTSIKGFSKSDLEKFRILFPPSILEQQKIANCLSSLDNLIKAESERIEQLKLHKKGLRQKLFPTMN